MTLGDAREWGQGAGSGTRARHWLAETRVERRRAWQCDMGLVGSIIMMIYLLMIYVVQDKQFKTAPP